MAAQEAEPRIGQATHQQHIRELGQAALLPTRLLLLLLLHQLLLLLHHRPTTSGSNAPLLLLHESGGRSCSRCRGLLLHHRSCGWVLLLLHRRRECWRRLLLLLKVLLKQLHEGGSLERCTRSSDGLKRERSACLAPLNIPRLAVDHLVVQALRMVPTDGGEPARTMSVCVPRRRRAHSAQDTSEVGRAERRSERPSGPGEIHTGRTRFCERAIGLKHARGAPPHD